MKRARIPILFLLALLLTAGCGNIVLPDKEGIQVLRESHAGGSFPISIEGKVTDPEGTPLGDITVAVIGCRLVQALQPIPASYRQLDNLHTDATGSYRTPATIWTDYTDLQLKASDNRGVYAADSVVVRNVQIGSVAPTLVLKKK